MTLVKQLGIPINLGGIPLLVVCVHLYFHNLPYAQTIVAICIVIISNYGPVMCLTCLFLFRPYRNGILGIANRLFSTVHGIAVSVYSSSVVNAMVPSGT
ncbi:hypothetical protein L596_012655 [Steinernema carpocapsae]|uniref:Uncharacterized protein n=1 Tax=Steinernema carpocapsae TaxID=34508 RepID=A0A4U5NY14_STECR|nr:hypothetical protein L596_012655 [Steinernema carpocapsae]